MISYKLGIVYFHLQPVSSSLVASLCWGYIGSMYTEQASKFHHSLQYILKENSIIYLRHALQKFHFVSTFIIFLLGFLNALYSIKLQIIDFPGERRRNWITFMSLFYL